MTWTVKLMNKRIWITIVVAATLALIGLSARAEETYGTYPNFKEMYSRINGLAEKYPRYATVGEYGKSAEGRPLLYVRIARPDGWKRPEALVAAGIHGNEWIGTAMAMAVAERLLSGAESDPWIASLLEKTEIWIIPSINPDGYTKTWKERNNPNARWIDMRRNANGVDLNRNFPLPAERSMDIEMAGSDDPDSIRYTGPYPYSEPETQAVRDFMKSHRFYAAIDYHSNWGTIFPPRCNGSACEKLFKTMLAEATARQSKVKYPVVAAWQADSFSGEMEDALFYDFGAMAVCWEIFTQSAANEQQMNPAYKGSFWGMNPADIDYWVENDRDATIAAIEKALDITDGEPVPEQARKPRLK